MLHTQAHTPDLDRMTSLRTKKEAERPDGSPKGQSLRGVPQPGLLSATGFTEPSRPAHSWQWGLQLAKALGDYQAHVVAPALHIQGELSRSLEESC